MIGYIIFHPGCNSNEHLDYIYGGGGGLGGGVWKCSQALFRSAWGKCKKLDFG